MVTPLALMSREDQLYGIASALRAVVDDGSMAYSMEANHYNDPYGYFVLRTACLLYTSVPCWVVRSSGSATRRPMMATTFNILRSPFLSQKNYSS